MKLARESLQYVELTGFVLPPDHTGLPIPATWLPWVELISEDRQGQSWRSKDGESKALRRID